MQQRGTAPDVFSYNGIMQAYVGGGDWAAALDVSTCVELCDKSSIVNYRSCTRLLLYCTFAVAKVILGTDIHCCICFPIAVSL